MLYNINSPYFKQFVSTSYSRKAKHQAIKQQKAVQAKGQTHPSSVEITWIELSKHCVNPSIWILINNNIYDVSSYLVEHPGGMDVLMNNAGLDATKAFLNINHSQYAVSLRDARLIGHIEKNPAPQNHEKIVKQAKKQAKLKNDPKLQIVKNHKTKNDCWLIINGIVVNATRYLNDHPGGVNKILDNAGTDATQLFESVGHSGQALRILRSLDVSLNKGSSCSTHVLAIILISLIILGIGWFVI